MSGLRKYSYIREVGGRTGKPLKVGVTPLPAIYEILIQRAKRKRHLT